MTRALTKTAKYLMAAMIAACTFGAPLNEATASLPVLGKPVQFHKGGTGDCSGCHATARSGENSNRFNLLGSDASSTCLRCHEAAVHEKQEYMVASADEALGAGMAPRQFTPGGDFGWLKKTYQWSEGSAPAKSAGERHGHNIIAQDFGYVADSKLVVAPGGTYSAQKLSCISCHDPHGKYRRNMDGSISASGLKIIASGSYQNSPDPGPNHSVSVYRMLAGKGYLGSQGEGRPFQADPPAAVAPDAYNRGEAGNDTRVAYGAGVSEWCANCHEAIHSAATTGIQQHRSGSSALLGREVSSNYNAYLSSGNLNGSPHSAYNSLVPFEMGTEEYTILKATANSNGSDLTGPTTRSNVMCLSCHRAHASGFTSMTRWNTNATFMVYNGQYPGIDNNAPAEYAQGRTEMEMKAAYYDRPASEFAFFQRGLCNKCHAKD